MNYRRLMLVVASCLMTGDRVWSQSNGELDLAGQWSVFVDIEDQYQVAVGVEGKDDSHLFVPVTLPGTLRESGLGFPVGRTTRWVGSLHDHLENDPRWIRFQSPNQFRVRTWLQPRYRYLGQAWYRRTFVIDRSWSGNRLRLYLERPHFQTEVWIDGVRIGSGDSLGTAHQFDLPTDLEPGEHELLIGVDNRIDRLNVGKNAHSVSDQTQTAWNGIVGKLSIRVLPRRRIEHMAVDCRTTSGKEGREDRVNVTLKVSSDEEVPKNDRIIVKVLQKGRVLGRSDQPVMLEPGTNTLSATVALDTVAPRWDEFHTELCELQVSLASLGRRTLRSEEFGFRTVGTHHGKITVNGRPTMLRGTVECCVFPKTGYPPTDIDSWRKIFEECKLHGLNHVRFHSWCPPKAAFRAADRIGIYLQVECGLWPDDSTALGTGLPIDSYLTRESARIIQAYGNHPSFIMLACGNEAKITAASNEFLSKWVAETSANEERFLVSAAAGWPALHGDRFHIIQEPRLQSWDSPMHSELNTHMPSLEDDHNSVLDQQMVPVIAHEAGQWTAYPDYRTSAKFTGSLKPKYQDVYQEMVSGGGMANEADRWVYASGRLQSLLYKEEIERLLRTDRIAGFQLLSLTDFPGQGSAFVGLLDAFWDPKPYHRRASFRRHCGPLVPLLRMKKHSWWSSEVFRARIDLSHFGPSDLSSASVTWTIDSPNQVIASGQFPARSIPNGRLTEIGQINQSLGRVSEPSKLCLRVSVIDNDNPGDQKTLASNDWSLWVYPALKPDSDVKRQPPLVETHFTKKTRRALTEGRDVLLIAQPDAVQGNLQAGFTSIFWNKAWLGTRGPDTMGIYCDADHPALSGFPNDGHTDWQWWSSIVDSKPMQLNHLPVSFEPIVGIVPNWIASERLAFLIEARVARGRIIVCSLNLGQAETDDSGRADPSRSHLLHSIKAYMRSPDFNPETQLTLDHLRGLVRDQSNAKALRSTASASSSHSRFPAHNVVDGDPNTIWHTHFPNPPANPHELVIDLQKIHELVGIKCAPRRDHINGRIKQYEIATSQDSKKWKTVATGSWESSVDWKIVSFEAPVRARFVKLVSLSSHSTNTHASLAEMDVLLSEDGSQ